MVKWIESDQAISVIQKKHRIGKARKWFVKQNGFCFLCGKPLDHTTTKDHLIPRGRGGVHNWSNIVLAHHECNHDKASSLPSIELLAKFKLIFDHFPKTYSGNYHGLYHNDEILRAEEEWKKMKFGDDFVGEVYYGEKNENSKRV